MNSNKKSHRFRNAVLFVFAIGLAYALWPRQASLRDFNPAAISKLESTMWRNYYDKDYPRLLVNLYSLNRDQYRFSPCDSVRLAILAATAAKDFQPTTNRVNAGRVIPKLESYFRLLRRRSGERFNVPSVAAAELDWWQLRRERATPATYGDVIASEEFQIYGVTNQSLRQAALMRARMMGYRDERRDGKMQPEDWKHIEEVLKQSYELLKTGASKELADKAAMK